MTARLSDGKLKASARRLLSAVEAAGVCEDVDYRAALVSCLGVCGDGRLAEHLTELLAYLRRGANVRDRYAVLRLLVRACESAGSLALASARIAERLRCAADASHCRRSDDSL